MQKIAINTCHGGFSLSPAVCEILDCQTYDYSGWDSERTDPRLIKAIESVTAQGGDPSGQYAEIKIVEVPDGVEWTLQDYDGVEAIHEEHRVWS